MFKLLIRCFGHKQPPISHRQAVAEQYCTVLYIYCRFCETLILCTLKISPLVKFASSERFFVLFILYCLYCNIKGIVSRDFVVCFLVSFDRSDISTHQEWVLLLLKVRFRIEFFNFRAWAWWAPEWKWCLNLSKYGAHTQEFFYIVYVDYYWRSC
jgi:hypothetical protein